MQQKNNIAAVTVVYNTPELIQDAIRSIKKYYPSLNITIVDGSEKNSICFKAVNILKNKHTNIKVIRPGYNIGHGRGVNLGIQHTDAKNILVFDSDIEMKSPCLELMLLSLCMNNVYGVGQVVTVDEFGKNDLSGIKYLHPHFCLFKKETYLNNPPFIHHGAPFIETMKYLKKKRIKVKNFPVADYILHKERGTRNAIVDLNNKQAIQKKASRFPMKQQVIRHAF